MTLYGQTLGVFKRENNELVFATEKRQSCIKSKLYVFRLRMCGLIFIRKKGFCFVVVVVFFFSLKVWVAMRVTAKRAVLCEISTQLT